MRSLPGVDHDDAFRMIDDPCVSRQPAGPVSVGKNRKPPRQAVPLPLDLRGLDPDESSLNGEDLHDGQEPAKCADFAMLDHDPIRLNRIMISSFCWSMISGQTLRVCPEGKPVPTFPDHALKKLLGRHAEQDPPDLFEMGGACLDLLRKRVHVAEAALERAAREDRVDTRSLVGEVC